MRPFLAVLVIAALAAPAAASVVLTDETFESSTADGNWFVKFYAPWCGHCKRLAPTWDRLGSDLGRDDVKVGKVDCTQHRTTCGGQGVRGYPTLKLFKQGAESVKYQGARDFDSFAAWLNTELGPAPAAGDADL